MESEQSLQQPQPTAKKGRGRPPKPKPDPNPNPAQPTSYSGPKKRGRPPKQPQQQQHPQQQQEQPVYVEKRRPGRPPKSFVQPGSDPVNRGVVRPPKSNAGTLGIGPGGSGRPRGRPKKSGLGLGPGVAGRPRGRPKKSVLGPVSRPIGKLPRGRPRKLAAGGGGSGGSVGMVVVGKRRGRKPRRLSGKPLGRPRKDASVARGIANEDLTKKLELIQLKVQEVVGIIKPYIANENAALTALQQLEELVTNITTPGEAPATSIPPPNATQPVSIGVDPSLTGPPTMPGPGHGPGSIFGIPGHFSVNLPALNSTAPMHLPSGMESQVSMSWVSSSGTQS